jgi:hypothetical protein
MPMPALVSSMRMPSYEFLFVVLISFFNLSLLSTNGETGIKIQNRTLAVF